MPKNSIEHFYDDKYDDYHHPAPQTLLEKLYVLLKEFELHRNDAAVQLLSPASSLLDVGAGFGELLMKARQKGFKKLYGIDVSSVVVDHCKRQLKKNNVTASISTQSVDEKTTFTNNSFDAVTMIAVLEHIFSPNNVLAEVHRILKPNGQLIIEVPNVVFIPRRIDFMFGKLPKTSDEPLYQDGHLQFFTQKSLADLLDKNGFEVEWKGCSGIGWKWRSLWPEMLGANIVVKARKRS